MWALARLRQLTQLIPELQYDFAVENQVDRSCQRIHSARMQLSWLMDTTPKLIWVVEEQEVEISSPLTVPSPAAPVRHGRAANPIAGIVGKFRN